MARHLHYPILNYQYAKLAALIVLFIMLDNTCTFLDNVLAVSDSFAESVSQQAFKHL